MDAIAKIIHQTWKTDVVPEAWRGYVESWKTMHPGWEHRVWTDEANRAFVAEHYPDLLATFDAYPYAIQRADAIRYCLLHHYGGVYVDMDIECLRPIDELIDGRGFLAVLEPPGQASWLGRNRVVSNAFMASSPGHPFAAATVGKMAGNPDPAAWPIKTCSRLRGRSWLAMCWRAIEGTTCRCYRAKWRFLTRQIRWSSTSCASG